MKDLELERKFLQPTLPDNLEQYPHKHIDQGYLAVVPDGPEVRVRQKGDEFFLTVKSDGEGERNEYEVKLTEAQFAELWKGTENHRLEKTRYNIPHDGRIAELDIFLGKLSGLVTLEIEFDTPEEMESFKPPKWFGQEVTKDSRYKNKNLAWSGLPEMIN